LQKHKGRRGALFGDVGKGREGGAKGDLSALAVPDDTEELSFVHML
jgi:hypothetical protein